MTDARFFETLEDAAGLRFDREDGLAEWSKVERCEEGSGKMDKLRNSVFEKPSIESKFCNSEQGDYCILRIGLPT